MNHFRKHYKMIIVSIIIALIGLFFFGYAMSKDKNLETITPQISR